MTVVGFRNWKNVKKQNNTTVEDVQEMSQYNALLTHKSECCKGTQSLEPGHEKTCLMPYANNKGADQPAHPRSLISTFVVRCLDSVMSLVSVTKSSSLMLASVAAQAGLCLAGSEIPKTRFVLSWPTFIWIWACAWQNKQNDMCAQRRLRSGWASESSLCSLWVAKDINLLQANSEDSDQSDLSLHWAHRSFCLFRHA